MQKKKSVLIIAYACEPDAPSEPGVGWNMIRETSKRYDVTAITRSNNRNLIEGHYKRSNEDASEGIIEWVYIDLPGLLQRLKKKIPFGIQIYYGIWQWKAYFVARERQRSVKFDIIHHLTFGVSWLAPPAVLIDAPFVWGPIGGGDIVPSFIMKHERLTNRVKEFGYQKFVSLGYKVSPLARNARKKCTAILFRNRSTEKNFPATNLNKRHIICETATGSAICPRKNQHKGDLEAICVGRMQYWKGYRYAIEGFHLYLKNGGRGNLTMLGDGPELKYIRAYCENNRLGDRVKIMGKVSMDTVQKHLDSSNVLIHPSFRDGGSWSVLEGMMKGLPVIAVNCSGSADMVNEDSGFLVSADSRDSLIAQFADALDCLDKNPELRRIFGVAAAERVKANYRWAVTVKKVNDIYESILNGSS